MASLDLHFWRLMAPKIEERQQTQAANLLGGGAADFADYKYRCGYLQAIKDVLADAEEAFRQMTDPNPDRRNPE